jgi:hypothetical protein
MSTFVPFRGEGGDSFCSDDRRGKKDGEGHICRIGRLGGKENYDCYSFGLSN